MTANLQMIYDAQNDVVTIQGVKYSGDFFRDLGVGGVAVGTILRVASRRDDGTIELVKVLD